jgi:acetyl esterase
MKFEQGYWLTREAMKWFWNNYTSNQTNLKDPMVSPLQGGWRGGEAYALKLLEAGVRVTAVRYHGTIHDFVMLNPIADDPAPRGPLSKHLIC